MVWCQGQHESKCLFCPLDKLAQVPAAQTLSLPVYSGTVWLWERACSAALAAYASTRIGCLHCI